MRQRGWPLLVKRAIDVAIAAPLLVVTAPVVAGAALAVRSTMGSPAFFRQLRPGYRERPFVLLKLRTMRNPEPGEEGGAFDKVRLTKLGRMLRSTSIDELPQLWNVLRGDMSLVGPRPLLISYLERYTTEQRRRHDVMPGLTGWAQVHGRNGLSWAQKFDLDVWYVDHWSPWLDGEILIRSVGAVLGRRGIAAAGAETMPEFTGSGEAVDGA